MGGLYHFGGLLHTEYLVIVGNMIYLLTVKEFNSFEPPHHCLQLLRRKVFKAIQLLITFSTFL